MREALVVVVIGSLCGNAFAQFSVTSASGSVEVSNSNGSGPQTSTSSNQNGYSLLLSNFGGTASANFVRSNGRLVVSTGASGTYFPMTDDYGSGTASSTVEFQTASGYYVRRTAVIGDPLRVGSASTTFRNLSNNSLITSDGYLAPGSYRVIATSSASDGSYNASLTLDFSQANTLCQFAPNVGVGVYTGTTVGAISNGGATPSCGSSAASPAVWYKFTPRGSGPINISTCGSSYDTVLTVYQSASCPSSVNQIACDDDGAGATCGIRDSRVTVNVTNGLSYYIRVSGYNGAAGSYVLHIGPDNDRCFSAQSISGAGTYPFDNRFADTDGAPLPSNEACTVGGTDPQVNGDVWYRFVPPHNGYTTANLCTISGWNSKIAVYSGEVCLGDGLFMGCPFQNCGNQSFAAFYAYKGTPYYFRVGGRSSSRGVGNLEVYYQPCQGDINNDGFVDGFDYDDFVTCFETGSCSAGPQGMTADFNGDGFVDGFDYDDFLFVFESAAC